MISRPGKLNARIASNPKRPIYMPIRAPSLFARTMTNPLLRRIALAILFATAAVPHLLAADDSSSSASRISRVTVNGRTDPLGIAADDISFGWSASSAERGTVQRAYQIKVGSTAGAGDVWDSGRVASSRQMDISLPANVILAAATRYHSPGSVPAM
jgi:alpha-L-rhamnosidase